MRRYLCIHLPQWPWQRASHQQPPLRHEPVVLGEPANVRCPKVAYCSELARQAGIRPGMPISEALALEPRLLVREEDRQADRQALEALAQWAERYGPAAGLEVAPCPQSLFVDVTGCGAYFDGEERLLDQADREWREAGWSVRLALADTLGAAWGLAHYSDHTPALALAGATEAALRPLPIAALRLPVALTELAAQLGLFHVAQLLDLRRADLASRLGAEVLARLDQALGRLPEVLVPHRPLPDVEVSQHFEFATDRRDVLARTLDQLTERIHAAVHARSLGIRQLEGWLYHEAAPPFRFEVRLFSAHRTAGDLRNLLHVRLEQIQLTAPVCGVRLRVTATELGTDRQGEFFPTDAIQHESLSRLIDGLSTRLGPAAVVRAVLLPDAQPECTWRLAPLLDQAKPPGAQARTVRKCTVNQPPDPETGSARPIQLWPKPLLVEVLSLVPDGPPWSFRWGSADYRILHAWGPERIETGWWRGPDVQRDYYAVATSAGTRFWLFRNRATGRWFLHGCFD